MDSQTPQVIVSKESKILLPVLSSHLLNVTIASRLPWKKRHWLPIKQCISFKIATLTFKTYNPINLPISTTLSLHTNLPDCSDLHPNTCCCIILLQVRIWQTFILLCCTFHLEFYPFHSGSALLLQPSVPLSRPTFCLPNLFFYSLVPWTNDWSAWPFSCYQLVVRDASGDVIRHRNWR